MNKSQNLLTSEELMQGFTIGAWEVLPGQGMLRSNGVEERPEPRVFDVLMTLARRSGDLVTRDELVQEVWNGRATADEPINRCISQLRGHLGDRRRPYQYIETLSRRGYRLIPEIRPLDTYGQGDSTATPIAVRGSTLFLKLRFGSAFALAYAATSWGILALTGRYFSPIDVPETIMSILVGVLLAGFPLLLGLAWYLNKQPPVEDSIREASRGTPGPRQLALMAGLVMLAGVFTWLSIRLIFEQKPDIVFEERPGAAIVVLPFANLSNDEDNEYFSDGLSEEIMNRLARFDGLQVVARTSAFSFKGSMTDARTIARSLNVTHLLDGSVRRDGDHLRVTAQLTDRDGFQLWSESYSGVLGGIFQLQDSIANDIVRHIGPSLPTPLGADSIDLVTPTGNLAAYELVLRGQYHLGRRNEEQIRMAIQLFQQAIKLDPLYGDAYVGLARAYALLPFYSEETFAHAFELARSAIDVGTRRVPSLATSAAGVLAFLQFRDSWHWLDAERNFQTALNVAPNDAELLQWYSQFQASVGRTRESLETAIRARALDPLSPVINHRLAVTYLWNGETQSAVDYFNLAQELGMPATTLPTAYLILLVRVGKISQASVIMKMTQLASGRSTDWIDPMVAAFRDPDQRSAAIEAVERSQQQGQIPNIYLFGLWTYLQEPARALAAARELSRTRAEFNPEFLFSPEAELLRRHADFSVLIREIGLEQYWKEAGWPAICRPRGDSFDCSSQGQDQLADKGSEPFL